jgi:ankyrin repeat protein
VTLPVPVKEYAAGAPVTNDVAELGRTPLYIAAKSGDQAAVWALVAAGAAVDKANSTGETPLHGAAEMGHVAVARQGLTLVHFSAQPKPFLKQNTP